MKNNRRFILFTLLLLSVSNVFTKPHNEEELNHDAQVELFAAPYFASEPKFTAQTHFNHLNYADVYNNYDGEDITVAIIDTGINYNHEDFWTVDGLQTNITSSSASFSSNGSTTVVKKVVSTHGQSVIMDYHGHGTAVAGTVAALFNGVGTVGVSPKAKLMVLKTNLYLNEIRDAIYYAADNGADIINMSFGVYKQTFTDEWGDKHDGVSNADTYFSAAFNYAMGKGVTLIAAAGNENTDRLSYPAAYTNVIGVGALANNSSTTSAYYSNYGYGNVTLVAPGTVYVPSYDVDYPSESSYGSTNGTSFAAPIVASAAALYKSMYPYASPTQIRDALVNSAYDIGSAGNDTTFGYGRLDLGRLLSDVIATDVTISPSSLVLRVGESAQLSTEFTPLDTTNKDGIYVSNDESIAAVDIDTGLVEALSPGETEIGFLSDDGPMDEISVTVLPNDSPITVTNITSETEDIVLGLNKTHTLALNLVPSSATYSDLNFTSSDPHVATVSTNGVITGLSLGTTTITVSSKLPGASLILTVTVRNTEIKNVTYAFTTKEWNASPVNWTSVKDGLGYDGGIRVQVSTGSSGAGAISPITYQNITKIEFGYSTNAKNGSGVVNAYLEQSKSSTKNTLIGSFTPTTTGGTTRRVGTIIPSGPPLSGYLNFEVNVSVNSIYIHDITITYEEVVAAPISVQDINFITTNFALTVGETKALTYSLSPSDASNKNVSFTSSKPSVASVSANGVVTALNAGTATITVITDDGGFSDSISVTVNELVLIEPTLVLNSDNFPLNYSFGAALDLSKLSATYTNAYGEVTTLSGTSLTLVSGNTKTLGAVVLSFSYKGITETLTINVTNAGSNENITPGVSNNYLLNSDSFTPTLTDTIKTGTFTSSNILYKGEGLRKLSNNKNFFIAAGGYIFNETAINTITSIELHYLSGGGASAPHNVRFSTSEITNTISTYEFTTSVGGQKRTITAPSGTTHFRLDVNKNLQANIKINYTSGGSLMFTHEEQANAYIDYFLSTTAKECAVSNVLSSTWEHLTTEYEGLTPEAQAIVRANNDHNFNARYNIIINGYAYNDFLNNSQMNMHVRPLNSNALIYVLLLGTGAFILYFSIMYKKKEETSINA